MYPLVRLRAFVRRVEMKERGSKRFAVWELVFVAFLVPNLSNLAFTVA